MRQRNFEVTAVWDDEAEVWYSESNITGLHIEADTLEDFEREVREHAASLVVENHYRDEKIDLTNLADFIPTIFWGHRHQRSDPA